MTGSQEVMGSTPVVSTMIYKEYKMEHKWLRLTHVQTGQPTNTWLYTNSVMGVTLHDNKWNVIELFNSDDKDPSDCIAVFDTLNQAKEYVESRLRS